MPPIHDTNGSNNIIGPFLPLPESQRPDVLFRVINKCGPEFGPGAPNGGFDHNGNLWPRSSTTTAVPSQDFDDHLSWTPVPISYISFFSDWDTAVRRRNWIIRNGGRMVDIVAIQSRNLENLYDARAIASALEYVEDNYAVPSYELSPYWRRRQVKHHQYEYLHDGPLMARDTQFLATYR